MNSATPRSDSDLLQLAIKGDHASLTILLEKYGPEARRAIAGKIPERHRSILSEDDVMQETYAEAFQDISKFIPRGERSFPAWLRKITERNFFEVIRELDAKKRGGGWVRLEPVSLEDSYVDLFEKLGATTTTPSRELMRKEAKDGLSRAMEQLPSAYRTVVEEYDLHGESVEEVAKLLGRSVGAVFMLRNRAHIMLKEILEKGSRLF